MIWLLIGVILGLVLGRSRALRGLLTIAAGVGLLLVILVAYLSYVGAIVGGLVWLRGYL